MATFESNLVDAFPKIVTSVVEHRFPRRSKRNLNIIRRRYGLDGQKLRTLKELAIVDDISKQAVQLVEKNFISALSQVLRGSKIRNRFSIQQGLCDSYESFCAALSQEGPIITDQVLASLLQDRFERVPENGYLKILMGVTGFEHSGTNITGFAPSICQFWYSKEVLGGGKLRSLFQCLSPVFGTTKWTEFFDLLTQGRPRSSWINAELIEAAAEVCSGIERRGEGDALQFRPTFQQLRSAADKAYRILEEVGKPMHYTDITRRINRLEAQDRGRRIVNERNISNQMVGDKRFLPTGRNGYWGLSTWQNLETETVVGATTRVLRSAGKPLSFSEILKRVQSLNPAAKEGTVRTYLSNRDEFHKIGKKYALREWRKGSSRTAQRRTIVSPAELYQALKKELSKSNPVLLRDLLERVRESTQLSEASIRQRIRSFEPLKTRRPVTGGRGLEVYCDESFFKLELNQITPPTIRSIVQDHVVSMLKAQPNKPWIKGEIYEKLLRDGREINRQTFYRYLDEIELPGIRQYSESGRKFVVFDHHEEIQRIELSLEGLDFSENTRRSVKRAIAMLTMEQVDLALFQLGQLFELELKTCLQTLRTHYPAQVTQANLRNLASMVNCAIELKLVDRPYYLHILRDQRNTLSHEIILDDERQALFDRARFVSELFLKYISYLNVKRKEFESKSNN